MRDTRLDGRDCARDTELRERVLERLRAVRDLPQRQDATPDGELRAAMLRRMDRDVLERIQQRFGGHIPPGRLEQARSRDTEFLSKREYERLLETRYGLDRGEAARVLGHYDPTEDKTWVTDARPLTLKRVAHERIHQLADPRAEAELRRPLYEGLTQVLAVEAVGDPHLKEDPSVYPHEVRVAHMVRGLAGSDAAERAYFAGDATALRAQVDARLGKGAFAEVVRLTQEQRWAEAERFIHERNTAGSWPW